MEEKNTKKIEEEIDFEKVAKTPIRWFGVVYPYFIGLMILGGMYFVLNLNHITENTIKPTIQDSTKLKVELPTKEAITLAGVDINSISISTPELVSRGKELYAASCASCHGADGKGDGPGGAGLNPKPRNFAGTEEWTNGNSIAAMYKTLEEGIAGTGMVAYEYIPVADRFAMIHFIHSLMKDYTKDTPEELALLDQTYSLAAGKVVPNQIPVAKAIVAVKRESDSLNNLAFALAQVAMLHKDKEGFDVYAKVVKDRYRSFFYLLNSDVWKNSNAEMRKYLSTSIQINGFSPAALLLSDIELTQLRMFFLSYLNNKEVATK